MLEMQYVLIQDRISASTEEKHSKHAETLQQYFPMKIPTQCFYFQLHWHFPAGPALTETIAFDFFIEGNWMSKCQSWRHDSLQYTNVEYSTIADRAINWGTVFPFLSRGRKMSLWKMVSYWAEMAGLSGARKTSYSKLHSWQPQDESVLRVSYLSKGWRMVMLSRKALYQERRSYQGAANRQLAFLALCALAAYAGCRDISPLSLMLFYCSGWSSAAKRSGCET